VVHPTGSPQLYLEITESRDADSRLRVVLRGEMDLATQDLLAARLRKLSGSGARIRLDLSQLDFIDCSAFQTVVGALQDARRDGWELEVDRRVSGQVARLVELIGGAPLLWPEDR
jgi:anti-anti-sigma factor